MIEKVFVLFAFACIPAVLCAGGVSDACIANPSNSSCVNYQYPSDAAMKNVMMLCKMMPQMPVCSVQNDICNQSQFQNDPACSPFGLWKIGCQDMPGMMGCGDYKALCLNPASVVQQCRLGVPPVPNTMTTTANVKAICAEMPSMDGCDKCQKPSACDLLSVYSELCMAMPDMSQCGAWTALCQAEPRWPFCNSN